ncbi:sulfurtransferase [Rossellomorea marisflavi]|uniref:sulfurtransferase n=1 Tax=Rossellomorea marisflavi TaxID=189381 RepID=UPI003459F127
MNFIKSSEWVYERLGDPSLAVIDCQAVLSTGEGSSLYNEEHIPGAVHFDLGQDLSGPVQEHGGRHPLPDLAVFVDKVGKAGIHQDSTIVLYDGGDAAPAARGWWLFRFIGHEKVYVMDGGLKEWRKKGFPITKEVPDPVERQYHPTLKTDMLAGVEEVRSIARGESEVALIDSRSSERYRGEEEPLDRVAGHIPGAVNFPWLDALQDGRYLDLEFQEHRYAGLDKKQRVIVYCGSGITATPNIISMLESGFEDVRLYAGSYSDWVSYPEHIVANPGISNQ